MKYQVGDEIYLELFFSSFLNNKGIIIELNYNNVEQIYHYSIKFDNMGRRSVSHNYIDHKKSLQLKREKILSLL